MATVTWNADLSRYEIRVDDALAGFAEVVVDGDVATFTHTEIDDAHQGQGLAGILAGEALADTAAQGRRIVPLCPYIRRYLDRHEVEGAVVEQRGR